MNSNLVTFFLNDHEKIIILLEKQDDIIDFFYEASILLNINNHNIQIARGFINDYVERLSIKLRCALSHELQLNLAIKKTLGYEWNEWLNEDNPNIVLLEDSEGKYWPGINHFIYGTNGGAQNKFAIWLYNDLLNNIVFEITPLFPGTLVDWEDPVEVKAYQEWMKKSYKPFYTSIIPKEVAEQWLKQCKLLLQTIHDNTKMLDEQEEL